GWGRPEVHGREERSQPERCRQAKGRLVMPQSGVELGRGHSSRDFAKELLRVGLVTRLARCLREVQRLVCGCGGEGDLVVSKITFGQVEQPRGEIGPHAERAARGDTVLQESAAVGDEPDPYPGEPQQGRRDWFPDRQIFSPADLEASPERWYRASEVTAADGDHARHRPRDRLAVCVPAPLGGAMRLGQTRVRRFEFATLGATPREPTTGRNVDRSVILRINSEIFAEDFLGAAIVATKVMALPHVLVRDVPQAAIACRAPDVDASLPVLDRGCRIALEVVIVHEGRIHSREPPTGAQLSRSGFGLTRQRQHLIEATELKQWRSQVEADVDRVLYRFLRLWQSAQRLEGRPKNAYRSDMGCMGGSVDTRLPVVGRGLGPDVS